ncbi:glycosyltransferase family 39 protein [Candidatus Daviesbacteria bacterium]|nr:glycosyltransferase family 39 protein [Candidatus Daviesbacteria bacterium]
MIFLVLIIAFFLRVINLNQSFWLDEAISAISIQQYSLVDLVVKFMPGDFHPPLHYLLIFFWGKVFGYSEISLRLPSVLLGVASVYIVYLLVKTLFNKRIGIFSSLIFSFNPLLIYYSQEARMYSLNVFLTVTSFLFFISFLKNKKNTMLPLTIANILLIYSDYVLFPILLVQILYLLIWGKYKLKNFLASLFLTLLSFIFWLPIFLNQLGLGEKTALTLSKWSEVVGGLSFKNLSLIFIKFIIGRISLDNKVIYGLLSLALFIFYLFLILFGIKKTRKENGLLLLWFTVPILFLGLISIYLPVLSYQRLLYTLPAMIILTAQGICILSRRWQILLISLVLSISLVAVFVFNINPKFQRENWREAIHFIENQKNISVTIFEDNNLIAPVKYYAKNTDNLIGGLKRIPVMTKDDLIDLNKLLRNDPKVYLFEYLVDITDPKRLLAQQLVSIGYNKMQTFNFNGVGFVTLYIR